MHKNYIFLILFSLEKIFGCNFELNLPSHYSFLRFFKSFPHEEEDFKKFFNINSGKKFYSDFIYEYKKIIDRKSKIEKLIKRNFKKNFPEDLNADLKKSLYLIFILNKIYEQKIILDYIYNQKTLIGKENLSLSENFFIYKEEESMKNLKYKYHTIFYYNNTLKNIRG